jgi:hypothetical protein
MSLAAMCRTRGVSSSLPSDSSDVWWDHGAGVPTSSEIVPEHAL